MKNAHFPHIALPTIDGFYVMGKKRKKKRKRILNCISLINGVVEVTFMFIGHL